MVVKRKATVLFSGGIDSAACAHMLKSQKFEVEALFFDFGQAAAAKEHVSARRLSKALGVPLKRHELLAGFSFGSGEIVGRNAFLVFAALLVTRGSAGVIALGLHAGTTYFDCSINFLQSISKITAEHTDGSASVIAPFISWTKKDVFEYFQTTGLLIKDTYSCEAGTERACGDCASCRDRKAFGC